MGELLQTFIARAACDVRVVQNPARFRPNDQPLLVGNRSRLTGDTGWQPEIPLATTVGDILEFWRGVVALA